MQPTGRLLGRWRGTADTGEVQFTVTADSVYPVGAGHLITVGGDTLPLYLDGLDIPPTPVLFNLRDSITGQRHYGQFRGGFFNNELGGWVYGATAPFGADSVSLTLIRY